MNTVGPPNPNQGFQKCEGLIAVRDFIIIRLRRVWDNEVVRELVGKLASELAQECREFVSKLATNLARAFLGVLMNRMGA